MPIQNTEKYHYSLNNKIYNSKQSETQMTTSFKHNNVLSFPKTAYVLSNTCTMHTNYDYSSLSLDGKQAARTAAL